MRIIFAAGGGSDSGDLVGVSNRGMGNEGLALSAQSEYKGYVFVKAPPLSLGAALAVERFATRCAGVPGSGGGGAGRLRVLTRTRTRTRFATRCAGVPGSGSGGGRAGRLRVRSARARARATCACACACARTRTRTRTRPARSARHARRERYAWSWLLARFIP
jgi:hypothetical protein